MLPAGRLASTCVFSITYRQTRFLSLPARHQEEALHMKKITFATAVSSVLAAMAIGLAVPALADAGSGSNVPSPAPIYPQSATGGANPYTPYGVNPYVPYGVFSQR
jgi:hypothetical protein